MTRARGEWHRREGLALLTDYYQLTMTAGYLKEGLAHREVCFEYTFRDLPPHTGFGVAAGLGPFLEYLEKLRFEEDDLDYLRSLEAFDEAFIAYLREFRPKCTVHAIPEGTLAFPHEPIVQVTGALFEAQLVETALLNFLNYQTLIATKAARIGLAAQGDPVLEFGLRRAHGPDGGLSGSRAAHIGGCATTSNVLAGKVYGIPVSGTLAHSWVMTYPSELDAFRAFVRHYPQHPILLVDTYDTLESGVPNAIVVFKEMLAAGQDFRPGIRLDSGDLAELSKAAYRMMTDAGLTDPLIVASNDLDEDRIADLKRQGAKINAWGVGTRLITSYDYPALGGVYKLAAVREAGEWTPRIKRSSNPDKGTDPGRKRPVRYYGPAGRPLGDVLHGWDEPAIESDCVVACSRLEPDVSVRIDHIESKGDLLEIVFEDGARRGDAPSLTQVRERALEQIAAIPEGLKRLHGPEAYPVLLSEGVGRLKASMLGARSG